MIRSNNNYDVDSLFPPTKLPRYDGSVEPLDNEYFNSPYDPEYTQNRFLSPNPDHPEFLQELKNDLFMWIDPTQGNVDNPHKLYGYTQNQVEKLGPIDVIRIDSMYGQPALHNATQAVLDASVSDILNRLTKAASVYLQRCSPKKNYEFLDILGESVDRFFIAEVRKWKLMVKHRYRIAGLIKYSPVNLYNLGNVLYHNPVADEGHFVTHLTGKQDARNVWGDHWQIEPRLLNYVGFTIDFSFRARKSNGQNMQLIEVIPRLVPVMCETKQKRLDIIDYYCGTISFNRNTNYELNERSGDNTTVQLNLDIIC